MRCHEIIGRVIDAWDDIGVALRIRCPKDDHTVELMRSLERADVGADVVEMSRLVFTRDQVVGTVGLVRGDEVGV